jgi:hypothetical protein
MITELKKQNKHLNSRGFDTRIIKKHSLKAENLKKIQEMFKDTPPAEEWIKDLRK